MGLLFKEVVLLSDLIFKPSYIIWIGPQDISFDLKKNWIYRTTMDKHIKTGENSKFCIIQF